MDASNSDWIDLDKDMAPEPPVGQPAWGMAPTPDQEIAVRVYDVEWSARVYDRVTGINLADNGLLVLQGNVVLGNRDVNTGIAAYAPGAWQLYEIDSIEFRDVVG